HGAQKIGSVAESCRGTHMSGGLSHCRPLIVVDDVPPESIRAAAHDIACRASKVNILALGTFAINGPVHHDLCGVVADEHMAHIGLQRQAEAHITLKLSGDLGAVSDGSPTVRDEHGFRGGQAHTPPTL